jgi:hypothetical protein
MIHIKKYFVLISDNNKAGHSGRKVWQNPITFANLSLLRHIGMEPE